MLGKRLMTVVLLSMVPLLCICGARFKHTEEFHQAYKVEPGTTIKVYNKNGCVDISKWDGDEVDVFALKSTRLRKSALEEVKIEVTTNGDMVIRTKHLKKRVRVSVCYEIKVPEDVLVEYVESSNGSIELEGTKGDADLKTSNGGISLTDVEGKISAKTSNGRISVQDINGDVYARTSNGRITVEDVNGYVDLKTSNGRITIRGVAGILNVKTSNGRIKAEVSSLKSDEANFKTSNGSIKLYISQDLNADIEMDTSNGSIEIHDIEIVVTKKKKTYMKGRIGEGGKKINVETSNGSIDLYKL